MLSGISLFFVFTGQAGTSNSLIELQLAMAVMESGEEMESRFSKLVSVALVCAQRNEECNEACARIATDNNASALGRGCLMR